MKRLFKMLGLVDTKIEEISVPNRNHFNPDLK